MELGSILAILQNNLNCLQHRVLVGIALKCIALLPLFYVLHSPHLHIKPLSVLARQIIYRNLCNTSRADQSKAIPWDHSLKLSKVQSSESPRGKEPGPVSTRK